jgi:hypothetical protein
MGSGGVFGCFMRKPLPTPFCQVAPGAPIHEDRSMLWIALGAVGIGGALLIYRTVRPMMRRRRKYDAGAVSEYWIEQHRVRSQDSTR